MASSPVLELIKEKTNIADVISLYVKDLRQAGRNFKACCPFHNEKTPSFTVSPDKGIYYCFGCHEGGDIFSFVMKIEGITFHEAAKKLALMAGVEYGDHSREFTKEEKERYAIKKALAFAGRFYCGQLFSPEGEKARLYIGGRKVNKTIAEQFELGWAPPYGQNLLDALKKDGYSIDIAEKAGLIKRYSDGRIRDAFRGRLIFPIKNQSGDIIAFGGRTLSPDIMPKYLNSAESPVFHKKMTLYGIDKALPEIRRTGKALVLEGYMDVIGAHQHGINYAVAPLGTALSAEHAKILGRAADNIVLMFDDDTAGIKASVRAAEIFMEAGMFVNIASLKDGLDPDEYINKYGRASFEMLINAAKDPIEFRISQFFKHRPNPSPQDKAAAIRILLHTVEKQHDEIVKSEWVRIIAERFNVDRDSIFRQLEKNASLQNNAKTVRLPASSPANTGKRTGGKSFAGNKQWQSGEKGIQGHTEKKENPYTADEKSKRPSSFSPLEKEILRIFMRNPSLIKNSAIEEKHFASAVAKKIYSVLLTLEDGKQKDIVGILAKRLPEIAPQIFSIAVSDTTEEKADDENLSDAIRLLKLSAAKRRMAELRKQKKMTPEQLHEYSLLAMELKATGEKFN